MYKLSHHRRSTTYKKSTLRAYCALRRGAKTLSNFVLNPLKPNENCREVVIKAGSFVRSQAFTSLSFVGDALFAVGVSMRWGVGIGVREDSDVSACGVRHGVFGDTGITISGGRKLFCV